MPLMKCLCIQDRHLLGEAGSTLMVTQILPTMSFTRCLYSNMQLPLVRLLKARLVSQDSSGEIIP